MNRWIRGAAIALVAVVLLGVPGVARADWLTGSTKVFSLAWNTVATWSQTRIDGSRVSGSGTVDGAGSLAVTKLANHYEFGFDFSGDGHLVLGGTFAPGARNADGSPLRGDAIWLESYPAPAGSLIEPAGSPDDSGGTWSVEGDDRLAISYTDVRHSNTFGVDGWSHLEATATPYAAVSEPTVLLVIAVGLLAAAWLARRRVESQDRRGARNRSR